MEGKVMFYDCVAFAACGLEYWALAGLGQRGYEGPVRMSYSHKGTRHAELLFIVFSVRKSRAA